jgi:hypothetical protein
VRQDFWYAFSASIDEGERASFYGKFQIARRDVVWKVTSKAIPAIPELIKMLSTEQRAKAVDGESPEVYSGRCFEWNLKSKSVVVYVLETALYDHTSNGLRSATQKRSIAGT